MCKKLKDSLRVAFLLSLFVFFVPFSSFALVDTAEVSIDPDTSCILTGGIETKFSVDIVVDENADSLMAYEILLCFDKNVIQVDSVFKGPLLGNNVFFFWEIESPDSDCVYITEAMLGYQAHTNGPGVLATIRFKTRGAGESDLDSDSLTLEGVNHPIPAKFINGEVYVDIPCLIANFSAEPASGPVPLEVHLTDSSQGGPTSWFWDFGDDSTSTLPDPIHIYRDTGYYDVKLVVSNGTETDSLIRYNYIQVVPPVVADFSGNPRSGFVSLMVLFTDSSEGNPTSWFWDFGDDSTSTERNPIHTYTDTGYFSVKLIASNQWDSDTIIKVDYIHVLPHLTADFSASPDTGLPPLSVRFTDLSVGGPTGWLWHFGDGDSSFQRNPVHVYSCDDTGYFDVRLIVWNQTERDTLTKENCIYVSPGVGAKFVAVPTSGAVPLTVQFIDSSLGCPSLWLWNFGDDSTDTTQNPLHTYNDTGYYDVRLIVSNEVDSDTMIKENYIHVLPPNPVLHWADRLGYQIDGVSPDTGLSGSLFTFRVVYADPLNFAPQGGYPKVNIDLNGDGDFEDENEGSFTMGVVNADTNYTDGREYLYNATLPASSDCQYSFSAKNSYGLDAVGEPTILKPGPMILDPSTALDLYIYASDITFSDPHPDEGEVFTVFATIHNNSDSNLTNVSVTFYHSGQLLNQVFIPNISSRGSATTSIPLSFDTKGFYPIKVVVDEENSFEEWNELNNFAIRPVIVGDYEFPGGIVVEAQLNSPVYPYSWITVTGNTHYTPEYLGVVSGATVTITIQETGAEYTTYTNDPGNFSIGFYGPTQAGEYSVKVGVTDYTLIGDTTLDLEVISQPGVDLAIRINLSKMDSLLQAEQDTLHTRIFNFGSEDAHNFSVGIYKDALLYYSYWVDSLLAGDSLAIPDTVISFDSSGWHTISGLVDVGDSVNEYNEGNNISTLSLYVWCNNPDLTVIKVVFSDSASKGEQPIKFDAWLVNVGGVAVSETFGVEFSDSIGDTIVSFDTVYVDFLAPFQSETAYVSTYYTYSDTLGHSFRVFADPESVITECDEENNMYGEGPCIDLKVTYHDIWFSDTDPQDGDSVRIIARVFNYGDISAFNSKVRFMVDGTAIGKDTTISRIYPDSFETIVSSETWQVDLSACSLIVECDPLDSIVECNELNNVAYCPLPYDLYAYYRSICPGSYPYVFSTCYPIVNDSLTIFGVLRNGGGFDVTGQIEIEVTDNIEGLLGIITVDSALNHQSNIASGTLRHAFTHYGWHTVTLHANYNYLYYECDREENNHYLAMIFVDSLQPDLPDLEVRSNYIEFSDDCPTWGDTLWFFVTTYNIGQAFAENVRIRFLVDELLVGDDILIDSIPVGPNNYHTDSSTAPWIVPEEFDVTHVCKIVVDPYNEILEIREDNNEATRALPIVRCGDVNEDCAVNVADVVYLINYLFINGPQPYPFPAADVNSDQVVNVTDVVYLINYLFLVPPGPPPCAGKQEPLAKVKPASAEVGIYIVKIDEQEATISIDGEFDVDVAAMQLESEWDKEKLELSEVLPTTRTQKVGLYHNNGKDGKLVVGIVDIGGKQCISAGKGGLLQLNMKSKVDSLDLSSLKINQIILVDQNAKELAVKIVDKIGEMNLPKEFSLSQNYPNPFNPQTVIQYALPHDCQVQVTIYNILGQKVRTLVNEYQKAGYKRVEWDSKSEQGEEVASGIYFYQIHAGKFDQVKKMVVIK